MTPEQILEWRDDQVTHALMYEVGLSVNKFRTLCDQALAYHTLALGRLGYNVGIEDAAKVCEQESQGEGITGTYQASWGEYLAKAIRALAAQPNNAAGQDSTPHKGNPGEIPAAPSSPPQAESPKDSTRRAPAAGGDTTLTDAYTRQPREGEAELCDADFARSLERVARLQHRAISSFMNPPENALPDYRAAFREALAAWEALTRG